MSNKNYVAEAFHAVIADSASTLEMKSIDLLTSNDIDADLLEMAKYGIARKGLIDITLGYKLETNGAITYEPFSISSLYSINNDIYFKVTVKTSVITTTFNISPTATNANAVMFLTAAFPYYCTIYYI